MYFVPSVLSVANSRFCENKANCARYQGPTVGSHSRGRSSYVPVMENSFLRVFIWALRRAMMDECI